MANSKRQVILNYIRDTVLAAIQTGSGYNFTIGNVERGLKPIDGLALSKFPALFIAETDEARKNLTTNQFFSTMTMRIIGYVKNSKGTDEAQQDLDDLIEDMTKAFEADRLMANHVTRTTITKVRTDVGDLQSLAACGLEVEVDYVTEGSTP